MIGVRVGVYAGLLLAIGSLVFAMVFPAAPASAQQRATRVGLVAACMGLPLLLLEWPLRAGFLGGGRLDAALDPSLLVIAAEGSQGIRFLLGALGLVAIGVGLMLQRRRPRVGGVIGSAGALAVAGGLAQAGHTGSYAAWLLGPLLTVHVLAAAFWVGALLPLHRLAAVAQDPAAAAVLERFGRVAAGVVAALVVAGLIMGWWLTGSVMALVTSAYGQVLLVKLAVVAALLGLAALNKWRLVPAFAAGDPRAGPALRRSIRFESTLAVAVVAVTALLTSAPSPPAG